jgi:hypothetical protein
MTVPVMVKLLLGRIRCSAAGIGDNLCLAIFGGTTPWAATYLVTRIGDKFAPAHYISKTELAFFFMLPAGANSYFRRAGGLLDHGSGREHRQGP